MKKNQNIPVLKVLAFDLDGTLSDSIPDLAAAANAMREHFGLLPLPSERVKSHVGDGLGVLVHRALTDSHEQLAPDNQWEDGFRFFISYYQAHIADYSQLYPGVKDGLTLLHKKLQLPLVLISNKPEQLCIQLLEALGIRSLFSLILGGDSLPEKKPSGLPLLHTCEIFDIEPDVLGMVGDSQNDVLAARQTGAYAIAVDYGYQEANTLGADLIISSIVELYEILSHDYRPTL